MSEKKTIKEFSGELGISRQRVLQIIDKLPTSKTPNKLGNKYFLTPQNQRDIKDMLKLKTTNKLTSNLSILQLNQKDIQLESLQKSLFEQQKLLDQQQQLHLKTQQLFEDEKKITIPNDNSLIIEQLNVEIDYLKKQNFELNTSVHNLQNLLDQQQQLQLKTQQLLEEKTKLLDLAQQKKWWQFWK